MPNNYLSVLYKHIIQVENENVGLKVCVCVCVGGGGGAQTYPPPPTSYAGDISLENAYLKVLLNRGAVVILYYLQ